MTAQDTDQRNGDDAENEKTPENEDREREPRHRLQQEVNTEFSYGNLSFKAQVRGWIVALLFVGGFFVLGLIWALSNILGQLGVFPDGK